MRNATILQSGLVVTTDNAAAIGEKELDVVRVTDEVTAYFCARTALLEQWAAGAEPDILLLHNFSGEASWPSYEQGVVKVFHEINCPVPTIQGSTETNMETLQSALAVTMIGHKKDDRCDESDLLWYTYGYPLVGNEVLEQGDLVADLRTIYEALQHGLVSRIWPVGSKGITAELERVVGEKIYESPLDLQKSAGPSTVVLIGINQKQQSEAETHFGALFHQIQF